MIGKEGTTKKSSKRGTRVTTSLLSRKISLKSKRSQVTIFIIIAVIVVAAAILFYLFWPKISPGGQGGEITPEKFIQNCLEEKMNEEITLISSQGGSAEPELYYMYEGNKLEYLCYSNEYYKRCVVQRPLLYKHIAQEIAQGIKEDEDSCFDDLIETYENDGYTINVLKKNSTRVELLPQRVVGTFGRELILKKGDQSSTISELNIVLNNNLYEHVGIASSIIEYEATYGDSETTTYMNLYPDLKVEKYKQGDGTTVYILSDRDEPENKFQFASRSMAWPAGYGIGE